MQSQAQVRPFFQPQPRPRFCIFRPGGLLAPLIPIDELPSWLRIINWSPSMFVGMQPVSLSWIPREGEYDVICHHCSSSVDSLHQSVSERNESPHSPASHTKSCPAGYFNPPAGCELPPDASKWPSELPMPVLGQPPFDPNILSSLGGMFMLNVNGLAANAAPVTAAFQKAFSPQSPPSLSDPSPEQSPDSLRESPQLTSSLTASLADAVSRCNADSASASAVLRQVENQPIAHTPNVASSPVVDHEGEKISAAIATSLCGKSVNESVASTRSLTVAVQRYKEVRKARAPVKKLSRGPSVISKTSVKTSRSRSSSIHKPHTAASRRRAKVRRRRRRADKVNVSKSPSAVSTGKPKPEQVNSATKRRDRREKRARGRKDKQPNSQYVHMMANWRTNAAH